MYRILCAYVIIKITHIYVNKGDFCDFFVNPTMFSCLSLEEPEMALAKHGTYSCPITMLTPMVLLCDSLPCLWVHQVVPILLLPKSYCFTTYTTRYSTFFPANISHMFYGENTSWNFVLTRHTISNLLPATINAGISHPFLY